MRPGALRPPDPRGPHELRSWGVEHVADALYDLIGR